MTAIAIAHVLAAVEAYACPLSVLGASIADPCPCARCAWPGECEPRDLRRLARHRRKRERSVRRAHRRDEKFGTLALALAAAKLAP